LYCTVLHLYCAVLYCAVLYCAVLHLYCTASVLYCAVLYLYCTIFHCDCVVFLCTLLYSTLLQYTVLNYTLLHAVLHFCTALYYAQIRSILGLVLHILCVCRALLADLQVDNIRSFFHSLYSVCCAAFSRWTARVEDS
jgi:hypothetical protein